MHMYTEIMHIYVCIYVCEYVYTYIYVSPYVFYFTLHRHGSPTELVDFPRTQCIASGRSRFPKISLVRNQNSLSLYFHTM